MYKNTYTYTKKAYLHIEHHQKRHIRDFKRVQGLRIIACIQQQQSGIDQHAEERECFEHWVVHYFLQWRIRGPLRAHAPFSACFVSSHTLPYHLDSCVCVCVCVCMHACMRAFVRSICIFAHSGFRYACMHECLCAYMCDLSTCFVSSHIWLIISLYIRMCGNIHT